MSEEKRKNGEKMKEGGNKIGEAMKEGDVKIGDEMTEGKRGGIRLLGIIITE